MKIYQIVWHTRGVQGFAYNIETLRQIARSIKPRDNYNPMYILEVDVHDPRATPVRHEIWD